MRIRDFQISNVQKHLLFQGKLPLPPFLDLIWLFFSILYMRNWFLIRARNPALLNLTGHVLKRQTRNPPTWNEVEAVLSLSTIFTIKHASFCYSDWVSPRGCCPCSIYANFFSKRLAQQLGHFSSLLTSQLTVLQVAICTLEQTTSVKKKITISGDRSQVGELDTLVWKTTSLAEPGLSCHYRES